MAKERFTSRVVKQRESAIQSALLDRFNRRGCFETTLDQVAADVGVGKGTLYRHHPSRTDLFGATLQAGIEALVRSCLEITDAHAADAQAALRALVGYLVALNRQGDSSSPATLARLDCGCNWLTPGSAREPRLVGALVPLVRHSQAAGVLDAAADPAWIATVMLALVNAVSPGGGPNRPGLTDDADRIVDVLRRSFAGARRPCRRPS